MKLRHKQEKSIIPLKETVTHLLSVIQSLQKDILMKVVPVEYAD